MTLATESIPKAWVASAVMLCVLGCSDLPEIQYETEHLRIGIAFDPPLCQGNLDHYERVVTTLEQQLQTRVEAPIDVYLWDDPTSFAESGWCDENVLGCYSKGAVYANFFSIEHELVHAVVDTFAQPTPFWSEGVAEAFGAPRLIFSITAPVEELDLQPPYLRYNTAGHFSRWLIETYGVELLRELLGARGSSREAFENTYAMTVEAAQELYFAQAPHAYGGFFSCGHPDLPQIGDLRWSETIEIDCSASDVRGTSKGIGAYRVLTISERGFYELTTTAEGGMIAPCLDEDLQAPVVESARLFAGGGHAKPVLELIPGRYELGVGHAGHETRTVELEVRAAPGPIPQTPESAG
jgi:hypothetical protein